MIKNFRVIIVFLVFLLCLSSCSGKKPKNTESIMNQKETAVAFWESGNGVMQMYSKLKGDTLYYVDARWDEEYGKLTETTICRQQRNQQEKETVTDFREGELLTYCIDDTENVYCLYAKVDEGKKAYYIRKVSACGEVCYDKNIKCQNIVWEWNDAASVADKSGRVCMMDPSGNLYLFDAEGDIVSVIRLALENHNSDFRLVNAGENGIYCYFRNGKEIIFREVLMAEGRLSERMERVIVEGQENAFLEVFDGFELGILVSDSDTLWKYDFENQKLERLLGWGDSTVNLKGYTINAIGILENTSLYIMAYQSYRDTAFVQIDYLEDSQIMERKTVTIGVLDGDVYDSYRSELEKPINAFNRSSRSYQVEFAFYASVDELYLALVRGEGSDIISLRNGIDMGVLTGKGVLEDLADYFAESGLEKDDILPSVWNAWIFHGKQVCIFPTFTLHGIMLESKNFNDGCLTPEEYLAMAEDNPDAVIGDYGDSSAYYITVLNNVIKADMDSYVDWKNLKCSFSSERFVSLVDRVKALKLPESTIYSTAAGNKGISVQELMDEKFYQGEILTIPYTCSAIENYSIIRDWYRDFAGIAGYPNREGKPYFELDAVMPLGINSASENKEGAWAFLAFLISEEYQSDLSTFPIRQAVYDNYINLEETAMGIKVNLSEEERDFIRFMTDNAYWVNSFRADRITSIIAEETASVWAGSKTAEEAAGIIQNRVSLFLNELNQ